MQAPLCLGLIVAQVIYLIVLTGEPYHLGEEVIADPLHIEEATIVLGVLGLIDVLGVLGVLGVVMVANLLIMVMIGGYETFVSRIRLDGHPDQPEWLSHVNANVRKMKLTMAIVGISSIHLLKTFIEVGALGAPRGGHRQPHRRRRHLRRGVLAGDDPRRAHRISGRPHLHRPHLGAQRTRALGHPCHVAARRQPGSSEAVAASSTDDERHHRLVRAEEYERMSRELRST